MIRERYLSGESIRRIAKDLGITNHKVRTTLMALNVVRRDKRLGGRTNGLKTNRILTYLKLGYSINRTAAMVQVSRSTVWRIKCHNMK